MFAVGREDRLTGNPIALVSLWTALMQCQVLMVILAKKNCQKKNSNNKTKIKLSLYCSVASDRTVLRTRFPVSAVCKRPCMRLILALIHILTVYIKLLMYQILEV